MTLNPILNATNDAEQALDSGVDNVIAAAEELRANVKHHLQRIRTAVATAQSAVGNLAVTTRNNPAATPAQQRAVVNAQRDVNRLAQQGQQAANGGNADGVDSTVNELNAIADAANRANAAQAPAPAAPVASQPVQPAQAQPPAPAAPVATTPARPAQANPNPYIDTTTSEWRDNVHNGLIDQGRRIVALERGGSMLTIAMIVGAIVGGLIGQWFFEGHWVNGAILGAFLGALVAPSVGQHRSSN